MSDPGGEAMKIGAKVELRVGGRKVSANEFARALQEDVLKMVEREVQQRVNRIRCPEHGKAAHVTPIRSAGQLTWEIRGCCQKLVAEVQKLLQ